MPVMAVPAADEADDALAARAAAGDERAFEQLVSRYQARVYRLACRLTADDGEAKDVLQETFLAAYRGLPSFRGESRFSTWLYRIATNAALMQRRARARRRTESLEEFLPCFDADGIHAAEPADLLAASRADELLDRKLLAEKARAGLDRLPDIYRDAFVLRDLEELSTAEVAELLEIDAAAVRQRVHRARLMLRGYLGGLVGGGS
jgi:RNA polymerase sigma-70 factor (ECF subfamily)